MVMVLAHFLVNLVAADLDCPEKWLYDEVIGK